MQILNKDGVLFGLCRLRLIGDKLFVRELHVYGPQVQLGDREKEKTQHRGLGILLMNEAENIGRHLKIKKILVISGIGVREYYRKLGYHLEDNYMVKRLK